MKRFLISSLLLFVIIVASADDNPLWMRYPSMSPDGQTIAFSFKGDLYTVPAAGGSATLLTMHEAYDYQPVWSPDGKYIAFASSRFGNFDIFLIPAEGGEAKRLTSFGLGEVPSGFSPDGKNILYYSLIQDDPDNAQFPTGSFGELYSVSTDGGRPVRVLTTPARGATYNKGGDKILYYDIKGYENAWRKHHTSSVTRDIWIYDVESRVHTKLSTFHGEDRNPVFGPGEEMFYYLSEQSGSFNIWKKNIEGNTRPSQVSSYENHPVRFLSISDAGMLCFGFNGEIYTGTDGSFERVSISIKGDERTNAVAYLKETKGATEVAVSKDGKQVAIIIRGEVFVTATDYNTTKRITNTPQQERSVSFSPDGRSVLYASERDSSWNVYQTSIVNEDEPYFSSATILEEETIIATEKEEFQPKYSPDGKEVAFLEEREILKVINLESRETRTILPKRYNYSYADGDQFYDWSPDSKWFLVEYSPHSTMHSDVALVNATGEEEIINLTNSGYYDGGATWAMDGKMMIYYSDREGNRSHGSWGSEGDFYGMFFTKEAYDKFRLSKEEREILEAKEKEDKDAKGDDDKEKDKKKEKEEDEVKPVEIDLKNLEDRKLRLTINSSDRADAVMTPDGKKMYYLSEGENGYDLWEQDFVKKETKLLIPLKSKRGGSLFLDKKGKTIIVATPKVIMKYGVDDKKQKPVTYMADFYLNRPLEREYMFEHVWRQVQKKFYDPELHGVDWEFYKEEYKRFLPYINNNEDFAEMLSEMLGELNASHTGAGYGKRDKSADETASLGLFYEFNAGGDGLLVKEIIKKGPFDNADSRLKAGMRIEKIDGMQILEGEDFFPLLNHKAKKPVLISIYDPEENERWDETVKPISFGEEYQLLYKRWVENRKQETEKLSDGRIGYVHVRGMNSASFREVYSEVLGRNYNKEALIVDTRFNGGGWLHDDLATFLNGKKYASFWPRGHEDFGGEPINKWTKLSVVLIGEGNYSDAHGFPVAYRAMGVGKTVGMPIPGTMTAVWWESLQDNTVYFGIPQIGVKDMKGNYHENLQFEPDVKVAQEYEVVVTGRDQQLEKAIEVLLNDLDN